VTLTASNDASPPSPPAADQGVYYFGYDRRLEPGEDVRIYVPLLRYLERSTGYRFKLMPLPHNGSVVDEMGGGRVQFAAIGTLSYLDAHKRYGVDALVVARNATGESEYRALIVTRSESGIRTIEDLRDRSLAFGAPNSTQGNLIPRIMLQQAGINVSELRAFQHHSSHFETASAVLSGRFDAGAIQDTLGRELVRSGQLRIVAESGPFPSSTISMARGLAPEVVEAVRQALLDFDPTGRDKAGLYQWERSEMPLGFARVDAAALERVQRLAEQVGLLK